MKTYRVVFVKNEVAACQEVDDRVISIQYLYELHKGNLIYAIIKALSEADALILAHEIIRKVGVGKNTI